MIDSRLEDYLEAKAVAGQGDEQKASALLSAVAGYQTSHSYFNSGNLLSALALRELGKESEANRMVTSWSNGISLIVYQSLFCHHLQSK